MKNIKNWKELLYRIAYGLVSRAIFALEDFRGEEYGKALFPTYGLMTMSFMFIVPLVIGLITAYQHDDITSSRKIAMITIGVHLNLVVTKEKTKISHDLRRIFQFR